MSTEALENTSIVVLDEQGEPLVLGSQEAADAVAGSDPVWCPESVNTPTPGENGCSASYTTIPDLLAAMQTSPQSFSQNGTIFLEKTSGQAFTTPLVLDEFERESGFFFQQSEHL